MIHTNIILYVSKSMPHFEKSSFTDLCYLENALYAWKNVFRVYRFAFVLYNKSSKYRKVEVVPFLAFFFFFQTATNSVNAYLPFLCEGQLYMHWSPRSPRMAARLSVCIVPTFKWDTMVFSLTWTINDRLARNQCVVHSHANDFTFLAGVWLTTLINRFHRATEEFWWTLNLWSVYCFCWKR